MTSFTLKSAALGIVAAAAAFATPALAAPVINCTATSCTFGNADPTLRSGTFVDTFVFTLPYAKRFVGSVTSTSVDFPRDNVNFIRPGGVRVDRTNFAVVSVGLVEIRSIDTILGRGTHTIRVAGSSGPDGFYNGFATLGAVPEPMTWALMILGFGVVGAGMRRRSANVARVTYA